METYRSDLTTRSAARSRRNRAMSEDACGPAVSSTRLLESFRSVDGGRFALLFDTIRFKEECSQCGYFMPKVINRYRCRGSPSCIAATLHPQVQSYLLWKVGVISQDAHFANLGISNKSSSLERAAAERE